MFSLVLRIVIALGALGIGLMIPDSASGVLWRIGAFGLAMHLFVEQLKRKELAPKGVEVLQIATDFACILGSTWVFKQVPEWIGLAWIALLPSLLARPRMPHSSGLPIVVGAMAAVVNLKIGFPTDPLIWAQILLPGIALFAFEAISNRPKPARILSPVSTEDRPVSPFALVEVAVAPEPQNVAEPDLRAKYKQLRDHASSTDLKARKDRRALQLLEKINKTTSDQLPAMANAIRELCGAKGITIYAITPGTQTGVVQATSGVVPDSVASRSLKIPTTSTGDEHWTDRLLETLRAPDDDEDCKLLPLRHQQRMVGLIWVSAESSAYLDAAIEIAHHLTSIAGMLIHQMVEKQQLFTRAVESETLYRICSVSEGAETPRTLLSRIVSDLYAQFGWDHVSAALIDEDSLLPIATEGQPMRLLDAMSFANGAGLTGWLRTQSPDLILTDTAEDLRCDRVEAAKRRVGTYVQFTIWLNSEAYAVLTIATQRANAITDRQLEMLSLIRGELTRSLERLQNRPVSVAEATPEIEPGVVSPIEFHKAASKGSGSMVILDLLRKEELKSEFGASNLEGALKEFVLKLKSQSPASSLLCARPDSVLVLLPQADEAEAGAWANQACAFAAISTTKTPEGRRVPMALRAKICNLKPITAAIETPEEVSEYAS